MSLVRPDTLVWDCQFCGNCGQQSRCPDCHTRLGEVEQPFFLLEVAGTWIKTSNGGQQSHWISKLWIIFIYIFNAFLSLWSSIIGMVDKKKGEWTRFGRSYNDLDDNLANGNRRIIRCDICCSYCCFCKSYNLWSSTLFKLHVVKETIHIFINIQ